jgi:hypothetical protein
MYFIKEQILIHYLRILKTEADSRFAVGSCLNLLTLYVLKVHKFRLTPFKPQLPEVSDPLNR